MNFTRIIILGFVTALSACQGNDHNNETVNTDTVAGMKFATDSNMITAAIDSSHNSKNGWQGTYKGVVPCADCEGIKTEISLNPDSTYMMSVEYFGKKDSHEIKTAGKFKWLDGSMIQLEGIKDAPSKYLVSEGRIIQLDMKGKKIEGASAERYNLYKGE